MERLLVLLLVLVVETVVLARIYMNRTEAYVSLSVQGLNIVDSYV